MTIHWEDLFRPQILKRGKALADKGAVYQMKVLENEELTALVEGTEIYEVTLSLRPGETVVMDCSCPYAADSNYCKHMAAVMYTYEGSSGHDKKNKEYLSKSKQHLSPGNVPDLKKDVNAIFRKRKDRSGFVRYYEGLKLGQELDWILDTSVDSLLKQGDYDAAFSVTAHMFNKLGTTVIDDDGTIGMVSDECYRVWKRISENGSDSQRAYMRKWMEERIEQKKLYDYMLDYLQEFITFELWDEVSAKQEIAKLDEQIAAVEADLDKEHLSECPYQYLAYRGRKELVLLRLQWMEKLGYSTAEIKKYKKAHQHFRILRELEVDEFLSAGENELAIEALKECISLSEPQSRFIGGYYYRLVSVFHDLGWTKQERDWERIRLLQSHSISVREYENLKSLYDPLEWLPVSAEILANTTDSETICQLLLEEEQMEALLDTVLKSEDIDLVNKYGPLFTSDIEKSGAILDLYEPYVESLADKARNTTRYEELGAYLVRMKKYVGGDVRVHALAQTWIAKYPTRKLMVKLLEEF